MEWWVSGHIASDKKYKYIKNIRVKGGIRQCTCIYSFVQKQNTKKRNQKLIRPITYRNRQNGVYRMDEWERGRRGAGQRALLISCCSNF